MQPVAYRCTNILGHVKFISVPEFDDDYPVGKFNMQEVVGLYLSPQVGHSLDACVYLHSGTEFWHPYEVSNGTCPDGCLSLYEGAVVHQPDDITTGILKSAHKAVDSLWAKLSKFHWSPQHPSSYTVAHPEHGGQVGLGVIAMRDPASFNLVYAELDGELKTILQHTEAIKLFVGYGCLLQTGEARLDISDQITLLTLDEFREWIQNADTQDTPEATIQRIRAAVKVPDIRRV